MKQTALFTNDTKCAPPSNIELYANVSGFYDRKSKSGLMPELLQLSAHWIRNKQILVLPRISIDKKFQTITIFYLPTFSNMYRNERTFSHSSSYRSTGAHFWRNDWRSPALPHVIKFLEIHTQNTTNCFTVVRFYRISGHSPCPIVCAMYIRIKMLQWQYRKENRIFRLNNISK